MNFERLLFQIFIFFVFVVFIIVTFGVFITLGGCVVGGTSVSVGVSRFFGRRFGGVVLRGRPVSVIDINITLQFCFLSNCFGFLLAGITIISVDNRLFVSDGIFNLFYFLHDTFNHGDFDGFFRRFGFWRHLGCRSCCFSNRFCFFRFDDITFNTFGGFCRLRCLFDLRRIGWIDGVSRILNLVLQVVAVSVNGRVVGHFRCRCFGRCVCRIRVLRLFARCGRYRDQNERLNIVTVFHGYATVARCETNS